MKLKIIDDFSFLNILIYLLIINLIICILCPVHIISLYFFKIPLSNMIYWENNALYVQFVFIPNLISYFLIIFIIPINIAGLFIEKILINLGKIPNKKISKFSNKQKIIFYIIITLANPHYLNKERLDSLILIV